MTGAYIFKATYLLVYGASATFFPHVICHFSENMIFAVVICFFLSCRGFQDDADMS